VTESLSEPSALSHISRLAHRAEGRMSELRHILEVIAAMRRNPREQENAQEHGESPTDFSGGRGAELWMFPAAVRRDLSKAIFEYYCRYLARK